MKGNILLNLHNFAPQIPSVLLYIIVIFEPVYENKLLHNLYPSSSLQISISDTHTIINTIYLQQLYLDF